MHVVHAPDQDVVMIIKSEHIRTCLDIEPCGDI
jgi:hypothetical protein